MLGALGRSGDEQLRGVDGLETGGVVFADPSLLKAQLIHPLAELKVPLHGESGVLVERMKGGEEDAVTYRKVRHSWLTSAILS